MLKNAEPVIDILKEINRKQNASTISTFDFSTLYTKIPHADLIDKLSKIINFVFKGGNNKFIRISKNGIAYWGCKSQSFPCFSKDSLKRAVSRLVTNCYFTVGNCVLRQSIGIPMGIDPAPFWANLYLYFYEETYVSNLIRVDRTKARKFNSTRRFIDDLITINDDGEFGREYRNIYPAELELKVEHSGVHATFLSLDNRIEDRKIIYKLYDKREDFPFSIVKLPHRASNIPTNLFYSALGGEFLRIARCSLIFVDFLP